MASPGPGRTEDIVEISPRPIYVEPTTEVERILARIWSAVLEVEAVGVLDDFFQLGGDSIKAMMVCSRARTAQLGLEPTQFAEHSTLADLAKVAGRVPSCSSVEDHDGEAGSWPPPLFLRGHLSETSSQTLALPYVVIEARRPFNGECLQQAANELLVHHAGLRMRFEEGPGGPLQVIDSEVKPVQVDVIDLSAVADADRAAAFEERLPGPESWNLRDGPVVRFIHVDLGRDGGRLIIMAHHAAVDRMSMEILAEDFQTAYNQLLGGHSVALPEKTTSIGAWVRYRRRQAGSGAFDGLLPWLEKVRAVPPVPIEAAAVPNRLCGCRLGVEPDLMHRVRENARAWRVQPSAVFAGAFARAWAEYLQRRAVLLSYILSGRRDVPPGFDLSRTVGCFVVWAPILVDVDASSRLEHVSRSLHAQFVQGERYQWLCERDPDLGNVSAGSVWVGYKTRKPVVTGSGGTRPDLRKPLYNRVGQVNMVQQDQPVTTDLLTGRPTDSYLRNRGFEIYLGANRCWIRFAAAGLTPSTIGRILRATVEHIAIGCTAQRSENSSVY